MIKINKPVSIGVLLLLFGWFTDELQAQEVLDQMIEYRRDNDEKVGEALDRISVSHGFYFAYQDSVVQVQKPVLLDRYEGILADFLQELLGDNFEFKELPGYVVIRYAPGVLDLDAQVENSSRQLTIKGFIRDRETGEGISFASAYDRSQLNSALTDDKGYFELKTKSSSSAWLTLSKDGYKDTTFMILPEVEIQASKKNGLFRYYQETGSADDVEQSFFGRMFIGFQQRFQRINLGGFFAESPFQMSLTPGLSSQGLFNSQMINTFSLNLIGGYTAGVDGFEAAGVFNINQKNVSYIQMAGAVNVVGGSLTGFQAAGISNKVFKKVRGVQVAGVINQSKEEVQGLQIAGILNQGDSKTGHQVAGLINSAKETRGFQVAGLSNRVEDHSEGMQVAGLFNVASGKAHHQVAGLFNKAGNVEGIQLAGLMNIAESSDYPVALLNFIQNGRKSLALQLDESAFTHMVFQSGGRVLYGVLGAGYKGGGNSYVYSLETGLGIYVLDRARYSMDIELVAQMMSDFKEVSYSTTSLRILHGLQIRPQLKVFLAPTLNFTTVEKDEVIKFKRWEIGEIVNDQRMWLLDVGATGGLQYVF